MSEENKILIDSNTEIAVGEVVEMHFNVQGGFWFEALQISLIEGRLKDKGYDLLSSYIPEDKSKLVLTMRYLPSSEPEMQTAGIGMAVTVAVIVVAGGLFTYLSLDKVYKITSSPAGKVAATGFGMFTIVIAVVIAYALYKRAK